MAVPANTYQTTAAVGNREDLTGPAYLMTPTETPFLSLAKKAKATNTLHSL